MTIRIGLLTTDLSLETIIENLTPDEIMKELKIRFNDESAALAFVDYQFLDEDKEEEETDPCCFFTDDADFYRDDDNEYLEELPW